MKDWLEAEDPGLSVKAKSVIGVEDVKAKDKTEQVVTVKILRHLQEGGWTVEGQMALVHLELGEGIDGELEAGNKQLCENLKDTQQG